MTINLTALARETMEKINNDTFTVVGPVEYIEAALRSVAQAQRDRDAQLVADAANDLITTDPKRLEGFNAGVVKLESAARDRILTSATEHK